jgi:hypothetical protein
MVETQITIQMVKALTAKYESERQLAMAEMMVFMRNPTAVGSHATLLDTIDSLIERVATADSKTAILTGYFTIEAVPDDGREQ